MLSQEQRTGVPEAVVVSDIVLVSLLRWVLKRHRFNDPIWPYSVGRFREEFRQLTQTCGLGFLNLQPYGLRRGGATELFRQQGMLDPVMLRGRWASHKVCRIYLNEALLEFSDDSLPPQLTQSLLHWAKALPHLSRPGTSVLNLVSGCLRQSGHTGGGLDSRTQIPFL